MSHKTFVPDVGKTVSVPQATKSGKTVKVRATIVSRKSAGIFLVMFLTGKLERCFGYVAFSDCSRPRKSRSKKYAFGGTVVGTMATVSGE